MAWPRRGVYFIFEQGETRSDTGDGPKVVRVGTHARPNGRVRRKAVDAPENRRRQSPGLESLGSSSAPRLSTGKSSIFRKWNNRHATDGMRNGELALERQVSQVMRFVWLAIKDETGPDSHHTFQLRPFPEHFTRLRLIGLARLAWP